jgi:cellulose synthase operon protein C
MIDVRRSMGRTARQIALAICLLSAAAPGVATAHKPKADAKAAYDRATAFLKKQDYRSARVELMNATAKDSQWGNAYVTQAEVALELFDPVGAQAAIDKAFSLGIPEEETAHLLGHAYWLQAKLEDAQDILESEAILDKNSIYADRILGRVYMDMGDTIAAEEVFARAVKAAPKDSRLWTEIARFRLVISNQGGAIEAADYALQLDPNNLRAIELRGRLVRTQYGVTAALPWFERALQISPNDISVLEEYAATLGEAGRYRDMLAQARKIISLDSNNPKAFYMQAIIAARAGNPNLARRLLQKVGSAFAELPGPRMLAGVIEFEAGNWTIAADHFEKLVEQQPTNLRARTLFARALYKSGQHQDAWDAIAPVIDRADADAYTLLLGGRILEALGEVKPAAGRFDRAAFPFIPKAQPLPEKQSLAGAAGAAQRDPRNANIVIPYIRLLLANGNSGAARAEANRLLDGNGGVLEAQLVAGDAEMASGNSSAAIAAYERARKISFSSPVMLRLVSAYRNSGNNAAASKAIQDYLTFNPTSLTAQRLWAYDLLDRSQWKDAIIWLQRARERLGYNDAVLNANIARAYTGAGKLDVALREARLAYRVHPANVMVTYVYGQTLLKSGKYPKGAYNLLRKANKLAPDRKDIAKDYAAAEKALKKSAPKAVVKKPASKRLDK